MGTPKFDLPDLNKPQSSAKFNLPEVDSNPLKTASIGDINYVSESDKGAFPGMNMDEYRAQDQGGLELLGKAAAQSASELVYGSLEAAGYLADLPQIYNILNGTEKEFGNWFSDLMKNTKQIIEKETPIYKTEEAQDFSPTDATWWASNAPSITSAVSLAIPSTALVKGVSAAGKALGAGKIMRNIGNAEKVILKGITGAVASRHMESIMEGAEAYKQAYNEALAETGNSDKASEIAGEVARDVYTSNIPLLLTDIPQYLTMFKILKNPAKGIVANKENIFKNVLLEAGEEAYQTVSSKEALLKQGIGESKYTNLIDRLVNEYYKDPDVLTSAFFGGIGGGVFSSYASYVSNKQTKASAEYKKQSAQKLEELRTSMLGNKETFAKTSDDAFTDLILKHAREGSIDKIKEDLDYFSSESNSTLEELGVDVKEFKDILSKRKKDLQVIESIYNDSYNKYGQDSDLFITDLAQKVNQHFVENRLIDIGKQLDNLYQEDYYNNLSFKLLEYKKVYNELMGISAIPQHENRFKSLRTSLQKKLESIKTEILEDNDLYPEYKTIDSINKAIDTSRSEQQIVLESLKKLNQIFSEDNRLNINKFNTEKGKESIKQKANNERLAQYETLLNNLVEDDKDNLAIFDSLINNDNIDPKVRDIAKEYKERKKIKLEASDRTQQKEVNKTSEAATLSAEDIEFKKADIEKRRKEELPKASKSVYDTGSYNGKSYNSWVDVEAEINAKYDEELSALQQSENVKQSLDLQEELNSNTNTQPELTDNTVEDDVSKDITIENQIEKSKAELYIVNKLFNSDGTPTENFAKYEWVNNPDELKIGTKIIISLDNNGEFKGDSFYNCKIKTVDEKDRLIGYLPIANKNSNPELINIRKQIFNDNGKSLFYTYVATKGKGDIWNLRDSNGMPIHQSISSVFGDNFVLGLSFGNTISVNNNPEVESQITTLKAKKGIIYAIASSANGILIPYRLFTRSLNQIEIDYILDLILNKHTKTNWKDISVQVNKITHEGAITILDGVQNLFHITEDSVVYGRFENGKGSKTRINLTQPITDGQINSLKSFLNSKIRQVDYLLTNTSEKYQDPITGKEYPNYNSFLNDNEVLTTDVNPSVHTHTPYIGIAPVAIKQGEDINIPELVIGSEDIEQDILDVTQNVANNVVPDNTKEKPATVRKRNIEDTKFKIEEDQISNPDKEKAIKWFVRNFPKVPIQVLDDLFEVHKKEGVKAWGVFKNAMVYIASAAPSSTVYHEAFHAVFNLMLSDKEREDILNEASKKYNIERSYDPEKTTDVLFDIVDYELKIAKALQSDKVRNPKNNLQGFFNDLEKQGVAKNQIEMLKSLNLEGKTKEEVLTDLLANYSYTIEINTAKIRQTETGITNDYIAYARTQEEREDLERLGYTFVREERGRYLYSPSEQSLGKTETPTQYYSNLTVPGGTNYTENEIVTPAINPSIVGHAQFASSNGIGWFRSDDKLKGFDKFAEKYAELDRERGYKSYETKGEVTKTRRILEVQSDLFQKGRDKDKIVNWQEIAYNKGDEGARKANQFLQLLNKDNNWVSFFVKSIIQDSVKKDYEKVLFPSGNTASKVEGHTTLEEFKKRKEERLRIVEGIIANPRPKSYVVYTHEEPHTQVDTLEEANRIKEELGLSFYSIQEVDDIKDYTIERDQLKRELERIEREGFGALRPIYNFYENTVTNILGKNYKVTKVTDEYGNTWNEVDLNLVSNNKILLKTDAEYYKTLSNDLQLEEKLADDFSLYKQNQDNKSIKGKILDFFKRLFDIVKYKLTNKITIDKLFRDIARGGYKKTVINNTLSKESEFYKLIPGFTSNEELSAIETINNTMFSIAQKYIPFVEEKLGYSIELSDVLNYISKERLYTETFNELKKYAEEDGLLGTGKGLDKIISNYYNSPLDESLLDKAIYNLTNYGFKAKNKDSNNIQHEDIEDLGFDLDESGRFVERYQSSYISIDGKESASKRMRRFIRTLKKVTGKWNEDGTPEFVYNEFGFPKYVDFHSTYAYLTRNLAGLQTYADMEQRILQLSEINPEFQLLYQRLLNSSDSFKSEFFTTFSKQNMRYLSVLYKTIEEESDDSVMVVGNDDISTYTKFRIVESNRASVSKLIVNNWKNNFYDLTKNSIVYNENGIKINREKAKSLYNDYKNIISDISTTKNINLQNISKITALLSSIGITVNPKSIDVYINRSNNPFNMLFNLIAGLNKATIENMIYQLALGNNPFEGEGSILNNLANIESLFYKDLTSDSFKNVENKSVFSFNLNNYWAKTFYDIKTNTNETKSKYDLDVYTKDNYILKTILSDKSNKLRDDFSLFYLDGLREQELGESGIKYSDMTPSQFHSTLINLFINQGNKDTCYYSLPIPADKPILPLVKFKRVIDKSILLDEYFNLFKNELNRIIQANKDIETYNINDLIENYHYKEGASNKKDKSGNAFKFQLFKDLDFEKYVDYKDSEGNLYLTDTDIKEIKNKIVSFINDEHSKYFNYLKSIGVLTYTNDILTSSGIDNKSLSKIKEYGNISKMIANYIANQTLFNMSMSQLGIGDLAYYKAKNNDVTVDASKRTPETTAPGLDLDITRSGSTFRLGIIKDSIVNTALYDGINQGDGQGYVSLKRYLAILKGLGRDTGKVLKAIKLLQEGKDVGDLDVIFQPIKGFYYGKRLDPKTGKQVPTQVKYSTIPLIPSITKMSDKLNTLREWMEKNDVDEVVFESAVKVGKSNIVKYDTPADLDNIKPLVLENRFWKLQQEVPEHHLDSENLFGTQIRKLILANIEPDYVYTIGDRKFNGTEIKDLYQNIIVDNVTESYDNLVTRISTDEKLRDILIAEVRKRELGKNYEEALELRHLPDGEKVLMVPPQIMKKFEELINSLFKNSVIKQKINGGTFVQVSSFGFDLKFIENKDGTITEAECYLPWWSKNKAPIDKEGNIDFNKIDDKLLSIIGYRIPTEGKYSMIRLKVKGFLPKESGSIVILPAEVVAQMGSDFDIDKLFIMIPNYDYQNGKYNKKEFNYNDIKDNSKEQRDNGLIDIIGSILSNEKHYKENIKPGGFEDLKAIASKVTELEGKSKETLNYILPTTQEEIRKRNQAGSALIGFAANHNVNQAVSQDVNFHLTKGHIAFNNLKESSFGRIRTINNKKVILEEQAQTLAAFVDNAKDPVAFYLNLNVYTIDVAEMIIRSGYTLTDAMMFTSQPILKEFISIYENNGKDYAAQKKAEKDILKKYKELTKDESIKPGIYNFNVDKLEKMISIGGLINTNKEVTPEQKTAFYSHQLKVFYTFLEYKEYSNALSAAIKATRADAVGTLPTMSGNREFMDNVEKLMESEALISVWNVFKQDSKYPMIKTFTELGIYEANDYLSQYLPWDSLSIRTVKKSILQLLNQSYTLGQELEEDINYNILTYIFSKIPFISENVNRKESIIKGNDSLAKRIQFLKNNDELIQNNEFIKRLDINISLNNDIDTIKFLNIFKYTGEEKDNIIKGWYDLLTSDNETYRKLGEDLLLYSIFTSGFKKSISSYFEYIPTEYLHETGFLGFWYNEMKKLNLEKDYLKPFIKQYLKNSKIKKLVPALTDTDISDIAFTDNLPTSIFIDSSTKSKIVADVEEVSEDKYINVYYPIILYKGKHFELQENIDNFAVYNLTQGLGNGTIYEYNFGYEPKTIFEDNKVPLTFNAFDINTILSYNNIVKDDKIVNDIESSNLNEWLENNPRYYYSQLRTMSEDEAADFVENENNQPTRITKDNIKDAIDLNNKIGDNIYAKQGNQYFISSINIKVSDDEAKERMKDCE